LLPAGLHIPLVYNTGGYDSDGNAKIIRWNNRYLYARHEVADAKVALKYSKIPNYPAVNRKIIKEMHRQVGDLYIDGQGLAKKGLLVRHLILPDNLAGTDSILQFVAENISTNTYLNLMDQYRPSFKAYKYPEINRRITIGEFNECNPKALLMGFTRLDNESRV
jgi:putative pyruvate formate lyase activating enzyme